MRNTLPPISSNLHPEELLFRFRRQTRADAIRSWATTQMLLIEAGERSPELLNGLVSSSTAQGAPLVATRDGISFSTNVATLPKIRAAMDSSTRPFASKETLLADLSRKSYFIAPLRKREVEGGKPFADRISVGRARNNDIVLRHDTVSKFHAYFDSDYDDVLWISDAKSTNGSFVGGKPVTPGDAKEVREGEEVRFGDITCVLCTPELAWDVVTGHLGLL